MFEQAVLTENLFLKDVDMLRQRTIRLLAEGQAEAHANPQRSIALLQAVLMAEIVCVLRYTAISISHDGLKNEWIGAEFQEQANDERRHMALAATRISQLGGTPDYDPQHLASRHALPPDGPGEFAQRIQENLAAEQAVVSLYRELIGYFEPRDPETAAMLQEIIHDEEDHAGDMEDLLVSYANN
ncbi:MAG TPA: ferritin-like domain-containing protein [Acidocella sp.]|jgi:bacterioferritin|nr:ferritin-like domain-containing protein [Acidocella sp.]